MTFKEKRTLMNNQVKLINERLNESYKIDYISCYGGFKLIKEDEKGRTYSSYLGENWRRNADEMLSYLQGIINAMNYLPF